VFTRSVNVENVNDEDVLSFIDIRK